MVHLVHRSERLAVRHLLHRVRMMLYKQASSSGACQASKATRGTTALHWVQPGTKHYLVAHVHVALPYSEPDILQAVCAASPSQNFEHLARAQDDTEDHWMCHLCALCRSVSCGGRTRHANARVLQSRPIRKCLGRCLEFSGI